MRFVNLSDVSLLAKKLLLGERIQDLVWSGLRGRACAQVTIGRFQLG